jgi:hypothetical protein
LFCLRLFDTHGAAVEQPDLLHEWVGGYDRRERSWLEHGLVDDRKLVHERQWH